MCVYDEITEGRISTATLISIETGWYTIININGIESSFVIEYFISNCFTKLVCNSRIVVIISLLFILLNMDSTFVRLSKYTRKILPPVSFPLITQKWYKLQPWHFAAFSNISLDTFVPNLVSLTHPSLQILGKTRQWYFWSIPYKRKLL